ncbi:27118_t:CDS:10, partial [Racocetra persica]
SSDHDEEIKRENDDSLDLLEQSVEVSSNDHDVATTHKGNDNPFIETTGVNSVKYKFALSWSHAIDNMLIKNGSKNDWLTRDRHNISVDFRNFQLTSIEKLKANPNLSYVKEVDMILCLSSFMYCNEFKPEYVKCSKKAWKEALPRSLAPKMLPTMAHSVIIEYNTLLNDKQSLKSKWRENWAKGNEFPTEEDKDIFCRYFTYLSSVSYNEDKKLDEDTFVHRYCHQVLEEIFSKTEYSLIWANGESESSKARRLLDGHNHGRKPDFRILSTIDELVFGEIKPPHCTDTANRSIIKLAEFMKGSLDLMINIYGNVFGLETYGNEIKIFSMDLAYDGLYRCYQLSKLLLPTENANFLNIITVVSTLYSLLERVNSTIITLSSYQLLTQPFSHNFCRKSNSSPKKVRVPVVRV